MNESTPQQGGFSASSNSVEDGRLRVSDDARQAEGEQIATENRRRLHAFYDFLSAQLAQHEIDWSPEEALQRFQQGDHVRPTEVEIEQHKYGHAELDEIELPEPLPPDDSRL